MPSLHTHSRKLMMLALMTLAPRFGLATNKGPDAGSYTGTDATVYSFVDISGAAGGTSVLAGTDDATAVLNLPFPFQFYSQTYTLACVSSNGALYLITNASACSGFNDFANVDLTSATPPNDLAALLPFWMDLTFQVPGSGSVFYETLGTPGSRRCVVQWNNAYPQGSANPVTFQLILFEGSNNILFQYETVNLGQANPASNGGLATIGIHNSGGLSSGQQIEWSFDAPILANASALLFSPGSSGSTAIYTIATSPSGLSVAVDGVTSVAPVAVSWMPGTTHTLSVMSPQTTAGVQNTFSSWSTGATTPQIMVPALATGGTYTANFATTYQLTTATNPVGVGSITPGAFLMPGASVTILAVASTGFVFDHYSGDATGTSNPVTVIMNGPKNVVANFRSSENPVLSASITGKSNGANNTRIWTIELVNTGLGSALSTLITGLTLTQVAGPVCSAAPSVISSLPVAFGDISPGGNVTSQVALNLSGCLSTARFTVLVNFSANSGSYTGSTTVFNQFP